MCRDGWREIQVALFLYIPHSFEPLLWVREAWRPRIRTHISRCGAPEFPFCVLFIMERKHKKRPSMLWYGVGGWMRTSLLRATGFERVRSHFLPREACKRCHTIEIIWNYFPYFKPRAPSERNAGRGKILKDFKLNPQFRPLFIKWRIWIWHKLS